MERIRLIVVGVVVGVGLFAPPSSAQQKGRDFSGTWVLDLSRSGSIEQNNDLPKATLVISAPQAEQLQIVSLRGAVHELVQFKFGPPDALRPRAPGSSGEHVGVILKWEGDELFTATPTNINDTAVTVVEQRRLNREGTEMTVETRVDVEHGYQGTTQNSSPRVKDVYVKKAP